MDVLVFMCVFLLSVIVCWVFMWIMTEAWLRGYPFFPQIDRS